jgi:hypothetical protein
MKKAVFLESSLFFPPYRCLGPGRDFLWLSEKENRVPNPNRWYFPTKLFESKSVWLLCQKTAYTLNSLKYNLNNNVHCINNFLEAI